MTLLLAAIAMTPAHTVQKQPRCGLSLLAAQTSIQPGKPFQVAIRFDIEPGWHIYWRNPGDSGVPTEVQWKLPTGYRLLKTEWARPHRFSPGGITSFGFERSGSLVATIQPPSSAAAAKAAVIRASAEWLICKEICLEDKGSAAIKLPVRNRVPAPSPNWAAVSNALPASKHALNLRAWVEPKGYVLRVRHSTHKGIGAKTAYFYPYDSELAAHSEPQVLKDDGTGFSLSIPRSRFEKGTATRLKGVLEFGWDPRQVSAVTIDVPVTVQTLTGRKT